MTAPADLAPVEVVRLNTSAPDFGERLSALLQWDVGAADDVTKAAAEIIADVRQRGDAALVELTGKFDRFECSDAAALEIPSSEFAAAYARLDSIERNALEFAAERIRSYHERQIDSGWDYLDAQSNRLGQRITPIERVGVYVPGGQAAYPSSVLMTVIPARVAGVTEITMVVPTPAGVRSSLVLAAAHLAGVDRAYAVGGAQAIAALAYGTRTIARVDKIVGPGGAFVAAAKRLVFGVVGIDVIAGPSEVLVVADGTVAPDWIALDLFSQAEHDAAAQAILISPDAAYLDEVSRAMARLLPERARRDTIRASLAARGALIEARDLQDCIAIANRIAPEHLELAVADPEALLAEVKHAGAIFMGAYSPEVIGDYAAGPSHVLPTFGTARFSSPLGVYDFVKRSSVIRLSAQGCETLARMSATLARGEGLESHARAAEVRVKGFDHNS